MLYLKMFNSWGQQDDKKAHLEKKKNAFYATIFDLLMTECQNKLHCHSAPDFVRALEWQHQHQFHLMAYYAVGTSGSPANMCTHEQFCFPHGPEYWEMFSHYCMYIKACAHEPVPSCTTPVPANTQSPEPKQNQGVGGVKCLTGGCSVSLCLSHFIYFLCLKAELLHPSTNNDRCSFKLQRGAEIFEVFLSREKANERNWYSIGKKKSSLVLLKDPHQSKNPSRPLSYTIYDQDKQKQLCSLLHYRSFLPAPIINVQRIEFSCSHQQQTKVLTDISSVSNSTENADLHRIPPSSFFPFCSFDTIF